MISTRHYKEYPWISKSTYLSYIIGCKHKFKRVYVEGSKGVASTYMMMGTSLHYIFEAFFKQIDRDFLWNLDYSKNHDTPYSPVYLYFKSVCMEIWDSPIRQPRFLRSIKSFARLEENHWHAVRSLTKVRTEAYSWFFPLSTEEFLMNILYRIYGTSDRRSIEPGGRMIIWDYKTGYIPAAAYRKGVDGIHAKAVDTKYTAQGNFYCMLWLLDNGYVFKHDGSRDKRGGLMWKCFKDGKKADLSFLEWGYIFTNAKKAIVMRKKSNMISMRSILNKLPIIRNPNQPYPREPDERRCKYCHLYEEECKDVIDTIEFH